MARVFGSARLAFYSLSVLSLVGAGFLASKHKKDEADSIKNYALGFSLPDGYREIHHGPQSLFLYKNKASNLLLRGAVNQIISDVNPTPELDTDGVAHYYLDRTSENQPEWKGQLLDEVEAKGATFRMIRRENKGKCVVTAFAVKGNTTVLVSLSGNGKEVQSIDGELPHFKEFIKTLHFDLHQMAD